MGGLLNKLKIYIASLVRNHPTITVLVVITAFGCIFYFLPVLLEEKLGILGGTNENINEEYRFLYYLCALAFSAILIIIAFYQLGGVRNNIKAEFLLGIDNRWGGKESLDARKIIHALIVDAEVQFGVMNNDNRDKITNNVGQRILELRTSSDSKDIDNFTILLTYLDLMETVGYLFKKEYVNLGDLNELCGHSLRFNYELFKKYIDDRSDRHGEFYECFKYTYNEIKRKEDKKNEL